MTNTFTCIINGVTYDIEPKLKVKETLNEELDTGTIVIPNLTEETDFQKGDIVKLSIYDGLGQLDEFTKNFLINSYSSEERIINSPKLIKYTIDLISPTMWLQNIQLPNKSNTISLDSTATIKTCKDFTNILIDLYGDDKFTLDTTLATLLDTKICPEFQWNKPSMWEALIDIFSVINYIPSIKEINSSDVFIISGLDLNMSNTMANSDLLNDFELYQEANNYAKSIDINIENGINNEVVAKTFKFEAVKSTDGLVNTDNAKMITPFDIYTLKKLVITFNNDDNSYSADGDGFNYTVTSSEPPYPALDRHVDELDITDYVVEKDVYNTKLISNKASAQSFDETLKRFYLYFEKGSNEINGMTYQDDNFLSLSTYPAIYFIVREAIRILAADDELGFYELPSTIYTQVLNYKWYAEYGTQNSDKVKIIKSNGIRNNLVITDGQDNSFVDINALVQQKQDLINRMGEVQANAKASIPNIADLIKLGDKINDYKVYSRTILFDVHSVNEMVNLSKNLVRRYQSQLLNMNKRFTQIASSADSFLRQEVKVINLKMTTTPTAYTSYAKILMTNYNGKTRIIDDDTTKHIGVVSYADGTNSDVFLLQSSNKYAGNTALMTMQFMDNYSVGMSYDTDNYALSGTPLTYVKYTDSNGEFETLHLIPFLGAETTTDYQDLPKITDYATINSNNSTLISNIEKYYLIKKDNREQISITLEFNIESDTNETVGLYVYNDFIKYCALFSSVSRTIKAGYIDSDLSLSYEPATSDITEDTTAIILFNTGNSIYITNFNDGTANENYHDNYVLYFEDEDLEKHILLGIKRYARKTITFYLVEEND